MTLRRTVRNLIEPVAGAGFVGLWVVAEAGRSPDVVVFVLLGVAIALSRILPRTSLVLVFAALAASTAGAAAVTTWVHSMTETDWPAYAAALVVPALVVANGRTRRTLRESLVAALIAALWVAALITAASGTLRWSSGRLIQWANVSAPVEARVFVTFALMLLAVGLSLWLLAWGGAGIVRFFRALLRDPLIRVRIKDALRLGPEPDDGPKLTARERDVLLLVSDGKSNADIAAALFLSEATVKSHLRSILTKLGLKSRTEIVAHAWRTGMVQAI